MLHSSLANLSDVLIRHNIIAKDKIKIVLLQQANLIPCYDCNQFKKIINRINNKSQIK